MRFKEVPLKDIIIKVVDNRGKSPKSFPFKTDDSYPLVEVNAIATPSSFIDLTKVKKFVSKETYSSWFRNGHPAEGDILISTVGSIAEVCKVSQEEVCIAQNVVALRPNKELIVPEYLFYILFSTNTKKELKALDISSVQPSLKVPHLLEFKIPLPNLNYQRTVSDLLSTIDNRIHTNYKIINLLIELSEALFKRWFINFDFPDSEDRPYKSSGGKMVESELGEIPEGFSVLHLSETTRFMSGGTPKTKVEEYWNGQIRFFTPKDVSNDLYVSSTEKHISDEGLANCNSRLYPKNTIFLTARGTVGKIALANKDMAMNQSCFALADKRGHQYFLLGTLQRLLRQIIQGANGAVFSAINLRDLNSLKYIAPSLDIIEQYENLVRPLFEKMSALQEENIKLTELRDVLLPRLLSGEIKLSQDGEVTVHEPV